MEPLLENLTLAPAAQLFELDPPHYTSSYGRRTEAVFKHNVPPAPMLISPENGLILYERVISTKAEHQLLDKLTKPKYYHPTPSIRKGGKGGGAHGAAAMSSSSPSPGAAPHVAHPQSATPQRPSSGSGHPHPHPSSAGPSSSSSAGQHHGAAAAAAAPDGTTAISISAAHASSEGHRIRAGQEPGGLQRGRSCSAGRAVGMGAGTGAVAGGGGHIRRKPLYPEDGPLKDYFSKERASVTATTVFTWGNRYKVGDCGGIGRSGIGGGGRGTLGLGLEREREGSSFSSYVPVQQKPPLRL